MNLPGTSATTLLSFLLKHQRLEGKIGGEEAGGVDAEGVGGAGFVGEDDGVAIYFVGAATGVGAAGAGDGGDGAVGVHVHGGMGGQVALEVQDELVRGAEGQGDGGRLRPRISHEHLVGAGPPGIGILGLGLPGFQHTARRAHQGGRQEDSSHFHRIRFFTKIINLPEILQMTDQVGHDGAGLFVWFLFAIFA